MGILKGISISVQLQKDDWNVNSDKTVFVYMNMYIPVWVSEGVHERDGQLGIHFVANNNMAQL